jgi:hypothetical protein
MPSPFFLFVEQSPSSQASSWIELKHEFESIGRWKVNWFIVEDGGRRFKTRVLIADETTLDLLGYTTEKHGASTSYPSCEMLLRDRFSSEFTNSEEVKIGRRRCSVGLLARNSEIPVPQFDAFMPLQSGIDSPEEFGVIAKRRVGLSPGQVEAELQGPVTEHPGWGKPTVQSLVEQLSAMVRAMVIVTLAAIAWALWHCRVKSLWAFVLLFARIVPLLCLPSAICLELIVARAHLVETGGIAPLASAIGWLMPMAGCGVLLPWLFRDNKMRCPVCQHSLAQPVWIGSVGKTIFEPFGTEWLCLAGHGRLLQSNSIALEPEAVWLL